MEQQSKRPFQHLPFSLPSEHDPGPKFFYDNFVSKFMPDIIQIMYAGIYIDDAAVEDLRHTVTEVLKNVDALLLRNKLIQKYQEQKAKSNQKKHFKKYVDATKKPEEFYRDYDYSLLHRTWLVNTYLDTIGCSADQREQWSVKDLKNYNIFKEDSVLVKIIDKSIAKHSDIVIASMKRLSEYKAKLYNKPRYDKANRKVSVEPFNAGSAKQKQELFSMLGIEPVAFSDKTGDGTWSRKNIEEIKKHTPDSQLDLHEIFQCIIDHSYSAIIQNNFIKAFDTYTIDSVMHGNIRLLGAKTARNTSNSPNLLNQPSSGSVYAKPLKKCFVAPEGMLVIQCDYKSLEDVVLANLSDDAGKIGILTDPTLDSHCYNAMGYFQKEVEEVVGAEGSFVDKVRRFVVGVDEGNSYLKDLRQQSKPHTFGLAYGKFPDEHKGGSITQEIFDNYHNVLYPDVTKFREEYVLKTAKNQGYLHLGLGFRIYTDDPDKDIRSINNACSQFWSILTLIAINEINYRIKKAGFSDKIIICSTIYDSIYAYIVPDPEIIKWYNDNIFEIGKKDFIPDQKVQNTLTCGIGRNWSEEINIPVNASAKQIKEILNSLN